MAQDSKIEWTKHTANLWHGCTKVHEGCDHCYAETLSKRWGNDVWGNDKPRKEIKSVWSDLAKYQKLAKEAGEIHRVFVGSMMDIFEKPMPVIDSKGNTNIDCHCDVCDGTLTTEHFRQWFFNSVVPASPNLLFLLLTKRPSNINKYIPESWKVNPPENVMFGTSPVNQETANKLVTQLLEVKGNKFLSVEPQLGEINLTALNEFGSINCLSGGLTFSTSEGICATGNGEKISWVIQGGESGHHKRPFDLKWAESLKKQCKQYNVPYFFKQIDKVQPIPDDLMVRQFPTSH